MIFTIICASCVFTSQISKLVIILFIVLSAILFFILFLCLKKNYLLLLFVISVICLIPVLSIYVKSVKIEQNNKLISENCVYAGKIYDMVENLDDNKIILYLSNVEMITENKSSKFYGNIYVYLNANGVDTSKLKIGGFVKIRNSNLTALNLSNNSGKDRSFISRNITAISYAYSFNLQIEDKISLTLRDKVKNNVYKSFEKTNTSFTNIGFAMMFGETSALDDDIYDIFKGAGIAHLLAVSGFHVSLIVGFLSIILTKLKTNKKLKLSIITILLIIYAYLCSFSVSVIRASLMSLLYIYSQNKNKEYDRLSSLSLVACVILLFAPMQLFNISFILSFVSILSIIFLMPIFERFLSKILHEKLSSSISISLAVCLGLSVFQLYYFGNFPILSIFSNIVTIPIVGGLFIFLMISVIFGSMFNISTYFINIFGFCIKYVIQFNNFIAKNGVFINLENFAVIAMALSLLVLFIASDYLFVRKRVKIPVLLGLIFTLMLMMI